MAKKAHPKELRLGYLDKWSSRWFQEENYKENLKEDQTIRETIQDKFRNGGIDEIVIERSPEKIKITIHSSRPGLIIGRGGEEIKKLKQILHNKVSKAKKIDIDIQEIRNPEARAAIVAQEVAQQIERHVPHRRAMKKALDKISIGDEIQGAKIEVAGRLNGTLIARSAKLSKGKIPLQTIRGKIDYSLKQAYTQWGTIGVKVWIYKGEVFEEE